MHEILGLLCGLGIVLAIVTVLGHGLWVLCTLLGRAVLQTPAPAPRPNCRACGNRLASPEEPCRACGWKQPDPPVSGTRLLEFLKERLTEFDARGKLSTESFQRLCEAIDVELQRIQPTEVVQRPATAEPLPPLVVALDESPAAIRPPVPPRPEILESNIFFEDEPPEDLPVNPHARSMPLAPAPAGAAPDRSQTRPTRDVVAARSPAVPTPTGSEWLASFMEQRNLNWGELVGGLLIVSGSIALVLSFWNQIAERPYLKFIVFNGFTAGIFGLGHYAGARLKLPTTSRAFFSIGTLLVPLNFLAFAAFSRDATSEGLATLAGEVMSLGLFGWLTWRAGQTITPQAPLELSLGVVGPSMTGLVIRRFVSEGSGGVTVLSLGLLPLAVYLGSLLHGYRNFRNANPDAEPDPESVRSQFRLLGAATFACAAPLGMLAFQTGDVAHALRWMAPLTALLAAPAIALGLTLWKRIHSPDRTTTRLVASALAIAGTLVLLSGVVLAWPHPGLMLLTSVVSCVVLSVLAYLRAIPLAHLLALPCAGFAYLLLIHLARQDLTWEAMPSARVTGSLISAESGTALVPLAAIFGALSAWMRKSRPEDSRFQALVAVVTAFVSVALAATLGLGRVGDPAGTTWVFATYGFTLLAAAIAAERRTVFQTQSASDPEQSPPSGASSRASSRQGTETGGINPRTLAGAGWAGAGLLLVACLQGATCRFASTLELAHPWVTGLLTHASLTLAACGVTGWRWWPFDLTSRNGRSNAVVADVLVQATLVSSAVAAFGLMTLFSRAAPADLARHLLWLSLLLFPVAWFRRSVRSDSAIVMAAFQSTLTLSVVFGVAAWIETRPWAARPRAVWLDPWSWQIQGVALALLGLAWTGIRLAANDLIRRADQPHHEGSATADLAISSSSTGGWRQELRDLLTPPRLSCDRVVGWLLLSGLVAVASYAAIPGVAQELSPRKLAIALESIPGEASPDDTRVVPALQHFELADIPHQHAGSYGCWVWWALMIALFAGWQLERRRTRHLAGILVAASLACPLLAYGWESQVAAASALRWFSVIFLAITSAVIWTWPRLSPQPLAARRAGAAWSPSEMGSRLSALVLVVAAAPLVAMGLFVSLAAIWHTVPDESLRQVVRGLAGVAAIALPTGLLLRWAAEFWRPRPPEQHAGDLPPVPVFDGRAFRGLEQASRLLWILGFGPLVAVGLFIVSAALRGNPVVGPEPGTFFHDLGLAVSYAVPVALGALVLVGHAICLKSSGYAFFGGLLFNVSATAAYLLVAARAGRKLDGALWVELSQINMIVSAIYALCWQTGAQLIRHSLIEPPEVGDVSGTRPAELSSQRTVPPLLVTQSLIGLTLLALFLVHGFERLLTTLGPTVELKALATPLGVVAWASSLGAAWQLVRASRWKIDAGFVCAGVWSLAMLVTFWGCRWDDGNGRGFQVFLVSHAAAGWLLALGGVARSHQGQAEPSAERSVAHWSLLLAGLTVVIAVRGLHLSTPPRLPVGVIVSAGVLVAVLGAWIRSRGFFYLTGVILSLARTLWWQHGASPPQAVRDDLTGCLAANVAIWCCPALAALFVELWRIGPGEPASSPATSLRESLRKIGFHRVAAIASIICLALVAAVGLLQDSVGAAPRTETAWRWLAMASSLVMCVSCLWDSRSRSPVFSLYFCGLVSLAVGLDLWNLRFREILWGGGRLLAGYSLLTAILWLRRRDLSLLASLLKIPARHQDAAAIHRWLSAVTTLLGSLVLLLALAVDLTFAELLLRLGLSSSAFAPIAALAILTGQSRGLFLHRVCLFGGAIAVVAWSWAWLDPTAVLMDRSVVLTAALAGVTTLYGLVFPKLPWRIESWRTASAQLVPLLCLLTWGSVMLVLGTEAARYAVSRNAGMGWGAILVMTVTILGLFAALLAAALIPGRDPFQWSDRRRTIYVYAAEGMLAILFLHVRLTIPELFSGYFARYWPFIVMVIAFLGVGLGEIARRQNRPVLSEPLERTGALLPLLPVLGFWLVPSQGHPSLVLLMAGGLYSVLSVMRRSFLFGLMAAVAANGGLWYFLHRVEGLGLLNHPQLWMIPFAVCILGAAFLNRQQLTETQMTTIRYLAAVTIYLSSTADIFLNGVAQAPWLPVILAGVSIAGIIAGILLRVRAFLFLGTGFLVLSMLTIIWHAAVDRHQTWLIWLTVVFAGVGILGLFALFEKKRQQVLQMVEKLKEWSP